mmetsp:Transcript_7390/g.16128  ORF Transcript_7390/g.16128 Transcript_7390/m.16128 type:complete len:215 (+) Transcript_7390:155-799(+)|eukprot:CAMPEP_0172559406 /NCGR_PEP_ID=MMETSP1067-20121228/83794_1 /TAXON_ID=265564 ORGANISM="Thalassiosira punctigera, Strain Tpunct2005C2" /NCGR_SAMPLE_ID=MMETSP1067 /ASSEMBLY_ACC=CAM_ASM_000444 /LENGTH=214 /DNA_ID=CAMNT_0013348987 /DNA_START=52 /DNA_END=696 /DNA_ORIENTATION=-
MLQYALLLSVLILTLRASSAWSPGSCLARHHRSSTRLMAEEGEEGDDAAADVGTKHSGYNVLGTELSCCCSNVGGSGIGTGFYRNGFCATGEMDLGRHTVCVSVTDEFLEYSKSVGNDLSTPMPQYSFPGLNEGDIWCLCAQRWAQAYNAGKAPKLFLQSTHEKTLDYVPLDVLKVFAIDADEAKAVVDKLNLQRNHLDELISKGAADDDDSFQ